MLDRVIFYGVLVVILVMLHQAIKLLRRALNSDNDRPRSPRLAAWMIILAAVTVAGCQFSFAFKSPNASPTIQAHPAIDSTPSPQEAKPDEGQIQPDN